MSVSLALRLRNATADVHREIETSLDLLGEHLRLADYVALLRAFHGFLAPWEARLAASGHVSAEEAAERRHSGRLEADLAHFGEQALADIAHAGALPRLDSAAAVLGSRYVIEGSTLGGRIVGPHLQRRFGLADGRGCAYFNGYGTRTGAMWKAFQAQLAHAPEAMHAAAVESARDTFRLLHDWLAQHRQCRKAVA